MSDIIKFEPSASLDWIVYRYPGNSFLNRTKLVVSPGQRALCVYLGKVEGEFKPGVSILNNANYPFLGKLFQGREADSYPYEIYFVNSTVQTKTKWTTKKAVYAKDSETGLLVHTGAVGSYIYRLRDPQFLLQAVIGEIESGEVIPYSYFQDQFDDCIQESVQHCLNALLVEQKIPALEISGCTRDLSKAVLSESFDFFAKYGFEITDLNTSSINVFDEDLEAMKKKKEYDVLGTSHVTERQLDISESWSKNQGTAGGMAASMMGLGIGLNALGINFGSNAQMVNSTSQVNGVNVNNSNAKPQQTVQTKVCSKCGASIPTGSKFCPECGAPSERHCTNCGALVNGNAKFCPECGNKL